MWTAIGANWKSILALAGAATVGAAGGAYWTLPRSVAEMREIQSQQGEQLDALADAVIRNTRAIQLVTCVQAANMIDVQPDSRAAVHACIVSFGVGPND